MVDLSSRDLYSMNLPRIQILSQANCRLDNERDLPANGPRRSCDSYQVTQLPYHVI